MTKPFQSIRQLFGRVLGNNPAGQDAAAPEYSTLGIPEAQPSPNGHSHSIGFAVENSEPDLEVQTADTRRLPQVAPEFLGGRNGGASQSRVAHEEGADEFGDAPLDLGDFSGGKAFAGDDPFLDVLDETVAHEEFFVEATPKRADSEAESSDAVAPVPAFEQSEQWSAASESAPASSASPANLSNLSPEAIDAIAERVVAQLSDKVVREIAWEVVPELSELLIMQKLKEK